MIIKSVKLQNFKSHVNSFISFSPGLNLIIGPNGAGKSSILEAIGLAFFGITNDKKLSQFITNEDYQKSTFVIVDFVSDSIHFVLTKEIFSNQSRVKLSDDNGLTIEGNSKVIEKMKNILRIETEPEKIYKNVITSYQNQITDIFGGRESDRRNFFNTLFDTEVYKKISSEHVKNYQDKLEMQLRDLENSAHFIESELEEKTSIFEEIEKLNEKLKMIEEELSNVLARREQLQSTLSNQTILKEKLNSMISERKGKEIKLDGLKRELANLKRIKSEAENAIEILRVYERDHVRYEETYQRMQEENEDISKARRELDEIQRVKESVSSKRIEIEKLLTSIYSNEERVKENALNSQKLTSQISASNDKVKELNSKLEELEDIKDVLLEKAKKIKNALETESYSEILELMQQKIDLSPRENLKMLMENLNESRDRIATVKSKIKDLLVAKQNLSSGICPYLRERCLNISGEPSKFFDPQIEQLNLELSNVIETKEKIELKMKEIEERQEEMRNSIKQFSDETDEELRKIYEEIASIKVLVRSEMENHKNIEETLSKLLNSNESLIRKIEEQRNEISKLQNDIDALSVNVLKEEEIKSRINELTIAYNSDMEILKSLKKGHELYIQNQKQALLLDDTNSRIELTNREISSIESEIERIDAEISKIKDTYDEKILEEAMIEFESITSHVNVLNMNLGELKATLNQKSRELEEVNKKRSRLEEIRNFIKKIKDKLLLSENLRALLGKMGSQVSTLYRETISVKATIKYNLLTKRSDLIVWNENYDLHVVSKKGDTLSDRSFEMLSGGEQVALALAMRMSMSTFFSKAGLAIFDEPTVNLDSERKSALSETLPDLLEDMEQVIVVTHDDTFREMTEKIISLKNVDGITTIEN